MLFNTLTFASPRIKLHASWSFSAIDIYFMVAVQGSCFPDVVHKNPFAKCHSSRNAPYCYIVRFQRLIIHIFTPWKFTRGGPPHRKPLLFFAPPRLHKSPAWLSLQAFRTMVAFLHLDGNGALRRGVSVGKWKLATSRQPSCSWPCLDMLTHGKRRFIKAVIWLSQEEKHVAHNFLRRKFISSVALTVLKQWSILYN